MIAIVGVVPEQGVEQILADTDLTNVPMAATFAKAGYPITRERVFLNATS